MTSGVVALLALLAATGVLVALVSAGLNTSPPRTGTTSVSRH
jgi:hypothetical protein